jgi:hypothetical protein
MFFHICKRVKDIYGEDVIPICIALGYDGTDISGGGGSAPKSATPINVRILNSSDNIFMLKKSTMLTGFAPLFTVSKINNVLICIYFKHSNVLLYLYF